MYAYHVLYSDDERRKLVSTEQSLDMEAETKVPTAIQGLESFSLSDPRDDEDEDDKGDLMDADSFFNLPDASDDDDEDDDDHR